MNCLIKLHWLDSLHRLIFNLHHLYLSMRFENGWKKIVFRSDATDNLRSPVFKIKLQGLLNFEKDVSSVTWIPKLYVIGQSYWAIIWIGNLFNLPEKFNCDVRIGRDATVFLASKPKDVVCSAVTLLVFRWRVVKAITYHRFDSFPAAIENATDIGTWLSGDLH